MCRRSKPENACSHKPNVLNPHARPFVSNHNLQKATACNFPSSESKNFPTDRNKFIHMVYEMGTYSSVFKVFCLLCLILSIFIVWKIISVPYEESKSMNNPKDLLDNLRAKNAERPIFAQLNINSIAPKFDYLVQLMNDNIDFLMVSETKIDESFPKTQFNIRGYSQPIRKDRTRHGGGIMFFMRVETWR